MCTFESECIFLPLLRLGTTATNKVYPVLVVAVVILLFFYYFGFSLVATSSCRGDSFTILSNLVNRVWLDYFSSLFKLLLFSFFFH